MVRSDLDELVFRGHRLHQRRSLGKEQDLGLVSCDGDGEFKIHDGTVVVDATWDPPRRRTTGWACGRKGRRWSWVRDEGTQPQRPPVWTDAGSGSVYERGSSFLRIPDPATHRPENGGWVISFPTYTTGR